jgi:multidrug efflux pump subunit AcrA (membrane-fusion protein)
MNKKIIIAGTVVLIGVSYLGIKLINHNSQTDTNSSKSQNEKVDFYTCPMHPQVHQDHPGDCPICHMRLVKVSSDNSMEKSHKEIQATEQQLELIGVQKYQVKKMNLNYEIPISGRLTNSNTLVFQIYERELSILKIGNKFSGISLSDPSAKLEGRITNIDNYLDPSSRTVRVSGSITKGSPSLKVESSFSGKVMVELADSIVVPENAIMHTGKGERVYIISSENKVRPQEVQVGLKANGHYQILAGLKETDIVTTGANFLLDSESKIRGEND